MKFDHVEFHTARGTLIIGAATDPEIAPWQRLLGQRRASAAAVVALSGLQRDQDAKLRQLAVRLDLLPRPAPMDARQIREVLQRAINSGRVAAVFVAERPHLSETSGAQGVLSRSRAMPASMSGSGSSQASNVARMTPLQRVQEMLRRVPSKLVSVAGLEAAFLALISPESLAMLAGSFVLLAAAQAVGVGEIADAVLAGVAYYQAGIAGLWALLDLIAAVKDATAATTDAELDKAADLFAGGTIVLGTSVLTFLLQRTRKKGGAENNKEDPYRPSSGGGRGRPGANEPVANPRLPQDVEVDPTAPKALPLNRPVGLSPTQNAEVQADIAQAQAEGATDFRVNQQQVDATGRRVGINRPDLQYTDINGKRVYVEYDTPASTRGRDHEVRIRANDPNATVIPKTVE